MLAAACSSPSPIHGTGYTYTFTYKYRTAAALERLSAHRSTSSYGTATLTITTPASSVLVFNYKSLIGSENLTASVTMMEEFVCPGAPVSAAQIGNKSC